MSDRVTHTDLLESLRKDLNPWIGKICYHSWLYEDAPFIITDVFAEIEYGMLGFYIQILILRNTEKAKRVITKTREHVGYEDISRRLKHFCANLKHITETDVKGYVDTLSVLR